jgi:hypothetical protein
MIGRIWHGWTKVENADAYLRLLQREVIPSIRSQTQGFDGVCVLRKEDVDGVQFLTLTLWDSMGSIEALVGDDHEAAFVPEEARELLDRFDERVVHFDVALLRVWPTGGGL